MSMQLVQQRRPHDRSNQKHKQESDNERKPFNRRTANSSPSAPRQSTPREKKSGSDETKQCGPEKASHLLQVWWKGPSCQALPISRGLQGLVWIGAMTHQDHQLSDRTERQNCGKELLAFVDSGV